MLFDIITGKGLFQLTWLGYILLTLGLTHVTIVCVTVYLHRCQAHRSLQLHPLVSHPMRFWLWLTTGLVTREWVAVHRKHHAKVETDEDPHSPATRGINAVLYHGAELYRDESAREETVKAYGHHGLPDDFVERKVYSACPSAGIVILFAAEFVLLGFFGAAIWAVQMFWIPFFAAGVINGLGHFKGYRNFDTDDNSTNLATLAVLIGGEELHNNHHAYPSSAKMSVKWWEFDVGWLYISVLRSLKLAQVLRLAPVPKTRHKDLLEVLTPATLKALIQGRPHVLREYAVKVVKPVLKSEFLTADTDHRRLLGRVKCTLLRHERHASEGDLSALKEAILNNRRLEVVYNFKRSLEDLLHNCRDQNQLLHSLQEWCHQAEQSGIQALCGFSRRIRNYSLRPQPMLKGIPAS